MPDPRDLSPALLSEQELQALKRDMEEAAAMADEVFAARQEGRRHEVRVVTEAVFCNPDKAQHWLSEPKARLGGLAPLEVLTTPQGAIQVEEMLLQIQEGFALCE